MGSPPIRMSAGFTVALTTARRFIFADCCAEACCVVAANIAMETRKSRRFIRSSFRALEGPQLAKSNRFRRTVARTAGANAATQQRHVAQDGYGSKAVSLKASRNFPLYTKKPSLM